MIYILIYIIGVIIVYIITGYLNDNENLNIPLCIIFLSWLYLLLIIIGYIISILGIISDKLNSITPTLKIFNKNK